MYLLSLLFALIPFYLLGAFPTGRLVAKRYGVKIEDHGSGNVGATNVARVIGKKAGIATLLGDIGKGIVGTLVARLFFKDPLVISLVGVSLVAGHCFSIPGKSKGGKGVATALGVLIGLDPLLALLAMVTFLGTFLGSKIVSLSSVTAALIAPVGGFFLGSPDTITIPVAIIALIIMIRHRPNLARIIEGSEPRFSKATPQSHEKRSSP